MCIYCVSIQRPTRSTRTDTRCPYTMLVLSQSSWAPGTANNVLIIRFADVLLMAAECEIEAGTLAKAREYINLVRAIAAKRSEEKTSELQALMRNLVCRLLIEKTKHDTHQPGINTQI